MLDSGAFTSWSRGEHITLNEVMRNYRRIVDTYAQFYKTIYMINLDVIPGSKGVTPNRSQVDAALVESDKNYEILSKEFGDVVIPVFHQGEEPERLHEVASQNPSYICVSPRNDLNEQQRIPWAQEVHQEIPGIATHGLAATGVDMMTKVPWHSVDSASWVMHAGYGGIIVQNRRGFTLLSVSRESPNRRFYRSHYENSGPDIQRIVQNQAESLDLTISELQQLPGAREYFNLMTLASISKRPTIKVPVQRHLWGF